MPLTALLDGNVVDVDDLGEQTWVRIHRPTGTRPDLRCRDHGCAMHAKQRRDSGTRFFAHDAGSDCPSAGESATHRRLKRAVAQAIRDAGWTARVEETIGSRRADVLAVNPATGTKVAWEVQASGQSADDAQQRTADYRREGVQTVWLATRRTYWATDVPSLRVRVKTGDVVAGIMHLDRTEPDPRWVMYDEPVDLRRAVDGVLARRLIWDPTERAWLPTRDLADGQRPRRTRPEPVASPDVLAPHEDDDVRVAVLRRQNEDRLAARRRGECIG